MLIVIVEIIFASQNCFNHLGIVFTLFLKLLYVCKTTKTTCDISGRQRFPFKNSDDANHVNCFASLVLCRNRLYSHHFQLLGVKTEYLFINGRFCTDGEWCPDLGNHNSDLTSRHLNPGMFLYSVEDPQLETKAGHEQICLVSRLPLESDRVII